MATIKGIRDKNQRNNIVDIIGDNINKGWPGIPPLKLRSIKVAENNQYDGKGEEDLHQLIIKPRLLTNNGDGRWDALAGK